MTPAARRSVIVTPAYLKKYGEPKVPQDLSSGHNCLLYAYPSTGNEWTFHGPDGEIRVKVSGNFKRPAGRDSLAPPPRPKMFFWPDADRGRFQQPDWQGHYSNLTL